MLTRAIPELTPSASRSEAYPKVDAVRRQLSWTHYRVLLSVDNPDARAFYETEAVSANGLPASPRQHLSSPHSCPTSTSEVLGRAEQAADSFQDR